jgi:hypothetical protein
MSATDYDTARGVFRTLRSQSRDVVLVWHTIDLGCWEFGVGRNWGGLRKGMSVHEQPGAQVDGIAPHKRRDSK